MGTDAPSGGVTGHTMAVAAAAFGAEAERTVPSPWSYAHGLWKPVEFYNFGHLL